MVERLKANDDEAYEELFRTYRDHVARFAYRMLGDSIEASEVIQQVFLRISREVRNFRCDLPLRTWIYRIAISETRKRLCWWRRKPRSAESDTLILRGLGRLSRDHRSILILRDIEGFSYPEISGILGLSPGAVKSRLARARADLRKVMALDVS